MNNVIFKSESEKSSENVYDFFSFCKSRFLLLDNNNNWDDSNWSDLYNFIKFAPKIKYNGIAQTLNKDFVDFAKAYITYHHYFQKKKFQSDELLALRLIEMSLLELIGVALIT